MRILPTPNQQNQKPNDSKSTQPEPNKLPQIYNFTCPQAKKEQFSCPQVTNYSGHSKMVFASQRNSTIWTEYHGMLQSNAFKKHAAFQR